MSRPPRELKGYTHQKLLNDLNDFMIKIKIYLHVNDQEDITQETKDKLFNNHSKPTLKEIDLIHDKLINVLEQDTYSLKKY